MLSNDCLLLFVPHLPLSTTQTLSSLSCCAHSCRRRIDAASPAGPPPTIKTSKGMDSRGSPSRSADAEKDRPTGGRLHSNVSRDTLLDVERERHNIMVVQGQRGLAMQSGTDAERSFGRGNAKMKKERHSEDVKEQTSAIFLGIVFVWMSPVGTGLNPTEQMQQANGSAGRMEQDDDASLSSQVSAARTLLCLK